LFIGHAADRTGPPIGLLHLVRWLRRNAEVDFEILLLQGGPLLGDFKSVAPVFLLDEWHLPRPFALAESLASNRGLKGFLPPIQRLGLRWRLRHLQRPDLVYVNTAWTVRALHYLPVPAPLVIAAVHELEVGLDYHLPKREHQLLFGRAAHYVAVSEAVKANLVTNHDVQPERVSVHYEMIEVRETSASASGRIRASLGIPPDAVVVGASGLTHWRKAPDLFLLLAKEVMGRRPDARVHFLWVGGDMGAADAWWLRYDLERSGVGDHVTFVPHQSDPLPWYAAMDVFVLPAREDAFPLVCLEAASAGVPVVCFDNGGMPEFVDDGVGGATVAYPDIGAMADVVIDLVEDPGRRRRLGGRASKRVRDHHDVGAVAPGLWAEILRWLQ